jgi:hypothetical protein
MSVDNGAFKTRFRLRIKNFVKSYLWKNDFADTIFGSNVLCKSHEAETSFAVAVRILMLQLVLCFYGAARPEIF